MATFGAWNREAILYATEKGETFDKPFIKEEIIFLGFQEGHLRPTSSSYRGNSALSCGTKIHCLGFSSFYPFPLTDQVSFID